MSPFVTWKPRCTLLLALTFRGSITFFIIVHPRTIGEGPPLPANCTLKAVTQGANNNEGTPRNVLSAFPKIAQGIWVGGEVEKKRFPIEQQQGLSWVRTMVQKNGQMFFDLPHPWRFRPYFDVGK